MQAEAEGLDKIYIAAGFEWRQSGCRSGCSLCIGMNEDVHANAERLPRATPIAILCAGGQRSSLIGNLLLARGCDNLQNVTLENVTLENVTGGMKAWTAASLPVEASD